MENFKVLNERENPLFNRREIRFAVNSKASPTYEKIKEFVSERFSSPKEFIKINKAGGRFGSNEFIIDINIYKTKKDFERVEGKPKEKKSAEKTEEKKEEVKEEKSE